MGRSLTVSSFLVTLKNSLNTRRLMATCLLPPELRGAQTAAAREAARRGVNRATPAAALEPELRPAGRR
jgi:hypothetical protein